MTEKVDTTSDVDITVENIAVANCKKHVVALVVDRELETESFGTRRKSIIVSGCIIEFGEHWFWISAGHVFDKKFKKEFDAGYRFHHWQFLFAREEESHLIYFAGLNISDENDNFTLARPDLRCSFKEEIHEDYAFICLSRDIRDKLSRVGVEPITEKNYLGRISLEDERYATYRFFGYPSELIRFNRDTREIYSEIVSLPIVERLEPTQKEPTLIGKHYDFVNETDDFRNTDGMSGGPVFCMWIDPENQDDHLLVSLFCGAGDFSRKVFVYEFKSLLPRLHEYAQTVS